MSRSKRFALGVTVGLVGLAVLACGPAARGQEMVPAGQPVIFQGHAPVPHGHYQLPPWQCQWCIRAPNAKNFGYFTPKWRTWPGEPRPDQTFPRSVGAEVVPTPQGTEEEPPAETVVTPERPAETLPGLPPSEVGPGPSEPSRPLEPGPGESLPGLPGLPGLPLEPETPAEPSEPSSPFHLEPLPGDDGVLPGMPLEPSMGPSSPPEREPPRGGLPGLPGVGEPFPNTPSDEGGLPGLEPFPSQGSAVDRLNHFQAQIGPVPSAEPPHRPSPSERESAPRLHPQTAAPPQAGPPVAQRATPVSQDYPAPGPVRWDRPGAGPGGPVARADWTAVVQPHMAADWPGAAAVEGPSEQQVSFEDREGWPERPAGPQPGVSPPVQGPPPALDGYCPVDLLDTETWSRGEERWAVTHRGRTYLLSGPDRLERFLANPDRYSPILSGLDPVLAVDCQREVPGSTEFCVVYDGRLYMFSSAESVARFRQDPAHYSVAASQPLY